MQIKLVKYLLGVYVLFVVYNTLIPFKFNHNLQEISILVNQIKWYPLWGEVKHISRTDIAGNILLFIPFGFLLYTILYYSRFKFPVLFSTISGAILSFAIEFLQLFEDSRDTAFHDFLNNSLGSFLGAILASIYLYRISAFTRKMFYKLLRTKPFLLILIILGLAQFFASIMPFTVSITFSDLAKSIKSSNIIPFDYQSIGKLFFNSPNSLDKFPFDYMAFIENILFWMVGGYLLMLCYRIYWKQKVYGKLLLLGIPLFYFPILEFVQLFIVSRIADINDILSGYIGILFGFIIYRLTRKVRRKYYHLDFDLLRIPLILYLIFILFSGLKPFDWTFDLSIISKSTHLYDLVPFYTYFKKTSLWDIYDLLNSLTFFLPISLYWTKFLRSQNKEFKYIYLKTTLTALLLGAFIEVTQIFSPTRVAEITDVLAYALGGTIGTFLIYYYEKQVKPIVKIMVRDVLEHA